MATKGAGEGGLQARQLLAQAGHDRDGGRHHLAVRSRHHRWGLQLLAGQRGLDGGGAGLDLAAPTRPPQRGHELGMGQPPASIWRRGQAEHGHRVTATGVAAEGGQGCWVEGPQGAAHDVGLSLAGHTSC
jgi:hypothetical protein